MKNTIIGLVLTNPFLTLIYSKYILKIYPNSENFTVISAAFTIVISIQLFYIGIVYLFKGSSE